MMSRVVQVILLLLVGMNLTAICQGHDIGNSHSSVHIALISEGERPKAESALHNDPGSKGQASSRHVAGERPSRPEGTGESASPSLPVDAAVRVCGIGPTSDAPAGTGLYVLSVGFAAQLGGPVIKPAVLSSALSSILRPQVTREPEEPPPRFACS